MIIKQYHNEQNVVGCHGGEEGKKERENTQCLIACYNIVY